MGGGFKEDIEDAVVRLRAHHVQLKYCQVLRVGTKGQGASVYFRDPDSSLLELIPYDNAKATG